MLPFSCDCIESKFVVAVWAWSFKMKIGLVCLWLQENEHFTLKFPAKDANFKAILSLFRICGSWGCAIANFDILVTRARHKILRWIAAIHVHGMNCEPFATTRMYMVSDAMWIIVCFGWKHQCALFNLILKRDFLNWNSGGDPITWRPALYTLVFTVYVCMM